MIGALIRCAGRQSLPKHFGSNNFSLYNNITACPSVQGRSAWKQLIVSWAQCIPISFGAARKRWKLFSRYPRQTSSTEVVTSYLSPVFLGQRQRTYITWTNSSQYVAQQGSVELRRQLNLRILPVCALEHPSPTFHLSVSPLH
jgi:hypothetical protein